LSLARKKQILTAALIVFTLWPLVHMELVRRYRISPWKLAGWGMYSMPRITPGIGILVQRGNEAPAPMPSVPPEVLTACDMFSSRRLWLHYLAKPDTIGALVLATHPDYRRVTIFTVEPVLDPTTGMVRTEQTDYHYQR
jgi:hypothetical protein